MYWSLLALGLTAQATPIPDQIRAIEAQRRVSLVAGDASSRDALLSDDFREIAADGRVRTKAQNLEDTRAGRVNWKIATVTEEDVRVYGDTAIYTARGHNEGLFDGAPFNRDVRFTRVYVRVAGQWRCVAAQSTPVPDGKQ